jgi:hypothetical protein
MVESAALLVDEVLSRLPMRQLTPGMACSRAMQEQLPRVLSFPFQLRFLFASPPDVMCRVLGIVYRAIETHLIQHAGWSRHTAKTGAVTLIQQFGSALNLNIHFHILFLGGVYVIGEEDLVFRSIRPPNPKVLELLVQVISQRVGRYLECQGPFAPNSRLSTSVLIIHRMTGWSRARQLDASTTPLLETAQTAPFKPVYACFYSRDMCETWVPKCLKGVVLA